MPFVPSLARVSSGAPALEQLLGTVLNEGSPMICTGMSLATSEAIFTSAVTTGPQVMPSENCAHSTMVLPLPSLSLLKALLSEEFRAEERRRKPKDPVSTSTPPIAWQFEVPGAHTVTVVNNPFA